MLDSRPPRPVLTDGVVTLRAPRPDDVEGSLEQGRDPLSQRWTSVPVPYSIEDAREFLAYLDQAWADGTEWHFVVEHEGAFGGTVTLRSEGSRRAELAYGAHPRVRGAGVMERACRLLLDWGFAERDLATVVWYAHRGNWASRRLAWRLGFAVEGSARQWLPQRGELHDTWIGTLLATDERRPRNPWLDVPRVEGNGVVLRRHREDDAERVYEAANDERTAYWLGQLPSPYTREVARTFLRDRSEGMAAGTDLHWMIADPATDQALGTVSIMHLANGQGEIGYWSHPDARGRGVMTEAVRLAVRHAFVDAEDGGLGLHRLTLYSAVDNTASVHVAEANGFVRTGVERQAIVCRDGKHDSVAFELLRDDWRTAGREL